MLQCISRMVDGGHFLNFCFKARRMEGTYDFVNFIKSFILILRITFIIIHVIFFRRKVRATQ